MNWHKKCPRETQVYCCEWVGRDLKCPLTNQNEQSGVMNWTTGPGNPERGSNNVQGGPPLISLGESPYCSEIEGWGIFQYTFSVDSQ